MRLFGISEHQSAFTDSLGTAQDERSFRTGRLSVGGRVIAPWALGGGTQLAPYVGLYADDRFSSDTAAASLVPEFSLRDGWSGRVTGGIGLGFAGGQRLSLDGEVGGITGSGGQSWTIGGRAAVPF